MAAGTLSAPGTEYGPCTGECQHTDCASARRDAAATCPRCGEHIGFEARFYRVDPERYADEWMQGGTTLTDTAGRTYKLVHARCIEG